MQTADRLCVRSVTSCLVALFALVWALSTACRDEPGGGPNIEIRKLGTIGSDGGEGALSGLPTSIARDSAGRWLVASSAELPGVYSPSGRFLGRIGAVGDGPGEYRRASFIVRSRGGTILIVDEPSRRLSTLSPGLEYLSSVILPTWPHDAVPAPDGGLLINAPSFDRGASGASVLHVTSAGTVAKAYGTTGRACARRCSSERARLIVPVRDGVWLVTRFFTPEAERWTSDGRRAAAFDIQSDWFRAYDSIRGPTPIRPPVPMLTGAWIDGRGRLWTLGQTADPQWPKGLGPLQQAREGGDSLYPVKAPVDVFNAFIEVRDTADGSLLARRRLDDAYYLMHIDGNVIGRVRETDDGWVLVDLFEATMS